MRGALAFLGASCAAVSLAWSQWSVPAKAKRRELLEIQDRLERKKGEISEYRRQAESMKRDLSRLAGETSQSGKVLLDMDRRIARAEAQKRELKARLGALHLAQGRWKGALTDELNGYYRRHLALSDWYGRAEVLERALRRSALLEEARYADGLRGSARDAAQEEEQARRRKRRLEIRTEQAKAEHSSRQTILRRREEVYREAQEKVSRTQQAIVELQQTASALTQLLRSLERKAPYKAKDAAAPFSEPLHSLPWPVQGKVESFFGKQHVPELQTWVIHQGIRLSAQREAAVRPVKAGKVIFVGPFRSYGRVLILDHGGAFHTIYGLLGDVRTEKGAWVRPDDVIAACGPSEDGAGRLYFEIRHGGDALDPLLWLRERAHSPPPRGGE